MIVLSIAVRAKPILRTRVVIGPAFLPCSIWRAGRVQVLCDAEQKTPIRDHVLHILPGLCYSVSIIMQHKIRTATEPLLVLVRGGGDLGTGVAHRLHRAGFRVLITELPQPLVIRRAVAFASAVYEGQIRVEGVQASLAHNLNQAQELLQQGVIPVLVDPEGALAAELQPPVVVDARMAKRPLDTRINAAQCVIGLGPGLHAGHDVHAVIETARGHNLGRVLLEGSAEPNTRVPGAVQGFTSERVIRAPCAGVFIGLRRIGDLVETGQTLAEVSQQSIHAHISGVVRGMLHDGLVVSNGQKVGDIDPRAIVEYCFTISDKARAVGGGVLEAILLLQSGRHHRGSEQGRGQRSMSDVV